MAIIFKSNAKPNIDTNKDYYSTGNPNLTFEGNDYQKLLNNINQKSNGNEDVRKKMLYEAALGMANSEMQNQDTSSLAYRENIDKQLKKIQGANGVDGATEYTGDDLRDQVINKPGEDWLGKLSQGLNDFNTGIGRGLDWVVDRVGDAAGAITHNDGIRDTIYNATNGDMLSVIPSIAEDIGLMATNAIAPGLGVGLTAAKNAIENGENIQRFVTGKDRITGQTLDEGQKNAAGIQAALGTGLALVPAIGGAIANRGLKGAGNALDNVVKGMAEEGKFNNMADKIVAEGTDKAAKLTSKADEAIARSEAAKAANKINNIPTSIQNSEGKYVVNPEYKGNLNWAKYNEAKANSLKDAASKAESNAAEESARIKNLGSEGPAIASGEKEFMEKGGVKGFSKMIGDYLLRGGWKEGVAADRIKNIPQGLDKLREAGSAFIGSMPSGTVDRAAKKAMKSGVTEEAGKAGEAAIKQGLDKQFEKGAVENLASKDNIKALRSGFDKIKKDPANIAKLTDEEQKAMSAYGRFADMGEAEWRDVLVNGNKEKLKGFEKQIETLEKAGTKQTGLLGKALGRKANISAEKFNQIYNGANAYYPGSKVGRAVGTLAGAGIVNAIANPDAAGGGLMSGMQGDRDENSTLDYLPLALTLMGTAALRKPMSKALARTATTGRGLSNLGRYSASSGKAYDMARLSALTNAAGRAAAVPKYTDEYNKKRSESGSLNNTDKLLDYLNNRSKYLNQYLAGE